MRGDGFPPVVWSVGTQHVHWHQFTQYLTEVDGAQTEKEGGRRRDQRVGERERASINKAFEIQPMEKVSHS